MKKSIFCILIFFLVNIATYSQNKKYLFASLSFNDKVWALSNINTINKTLKISNSVLNTMDSLSNIDDKFYNKKIESGKYDAFRHLLWMYELSSEIGVKKARRIGNIYENYNAYLYKINPQSGYDKTSMVMDLYNNEVGIYLYLKYGKDNKLIINHIKQTIDKGYVKIISKNKEFKNLDKNNLIIEDINWKGKWENQRCLINSNNSICE